MTKKKDLPVMPNVFLAESTNGNLNDNAYEYQLRMTTGIIQKQTVQLLNHFAKHNGCIHESAIIQGLLSGLVTMFNSILEPTDDEAIKVMRLAAFEKLKDAVLVIAPEVMGNMVKFYNSIIDITLRDRDIDDEPHISISLDANALFPSSPAASLTIPKPEPTGPSTPARWLN